MCSIMLGYVVLCYVPLQCFMSHYVAFCYIILHYVTLCYITLHYVTLFYILLCCFTLCYVLVCYILLFVVYSLLVMFCQYASHFSFNVKKCTLPCDYTMTRTPFIWWRHSKFYNFWNEFSLWCFKYVFGRKAR